MIGTHQPTGALPGVQIQAVPVGGLEVTHNGRPARLAIITEDGEVVAAGPEVAREARAVAVNNYRDILQGRGYMLSRTVAKAGV